MDSFNVYITGVGGQGIGMLSESILRAIDHAGFPVKAVDTHGLAQRGGIVVSQIRIGKDVHSPLIPLMSAHLIISLERHEALRGINTMAKAGSTLVYYDTVWQPLPVRLHQKQEIRSQEVDQACAALQVKCVRLEKTRLDDVRMQNMVVLATVASRSLIPEVLPDHYLQALNDLMSGDLLADNLALFKEMAGL